MKIQDLQNNGLDILKNVTDALEKDKISYFLAYGTQLGASRHQDVIPWDYDFDIGCFKSDFDKIRNCLDKLENYDVVYNEILKHNKSLASIMIYEKSKSKYYRENNCGMYLDIFLYDNTPKLTKIVKVLYKCNYFIYSMKRKIYYYGFKNLYKILRLENFNVIKSLVFIVAFFVINLFSKLINWYLDYKKEDSEFSFSTKANAHALDTEKFTHPKSLIKQKLVKKAKIKNYTFFEFEDILSYLNLAFGDTWKKHPSKAQIKKQILKMFPKVITEHKIIKTIEKEKKS